MTLTPGAECKKSLSVSVVLLSWRYIQPTARCQLSGEMGSLKEWTTFEMGYGSLQILEKRRHGREWNTKRISNSLGPSLDIQATAQSNKFLLKASK
jgi:hypothetical protein